MQVNKYTMDRSSFVVMEIMHLHADSAWDFRTVFLNGLPQGVLPKFIKMGGFLPQKMNTINKKPRNPEGIA